MGFITISGWPNRGEVLSDRQPAFVRQAACQSRSNTRADRALLAVAVAFVVAVTVVVTVAIAIVVTIPVPVTTSVMITFTELAVMVAVMFTLAFVLTESSFSFVGPGVIVVHPAVFSIPEAVKESLSVVMCCHPASPGIRGPRPEAFVPTVVPARRVPVTLHPHEIRTGTRRPECNDAGSGRRTNSDSDRDLSEYGQGEQ
jgi:hypothetical protein